MVTKIVNSFQLFVKQLKTINIFALDGGYYGFLHKLSWIVRELSNNGELSELAKYGITGLSGLTWVTIVKQLAQPRNNFYNWF